MNIRILLFIAILFTNFSLCAQKETTLSADSAQILMEAGNNAYQAKDYQSAIFNYLQIVDAGYQSAVLHYNLGNAYFKVGDKASALLWYERALRMNPNNEDIKHNIAFVNQKLTDKIDILPEIFIVRWWKSIATLCNGETWTIISIICNIILFTALLFMFLSRRNWIRKTGLVIAILSLIFTIFSIIFAHRQTYYYTKNPEGIITTTVISGKSTPDNSGTDLFIIHEGLKVKITDQMNEWIEIQIPNGEKGWIKEDNLEII